MEATNIETPAKFKSIVESIEKMSVLDLNELVKFLEQKFGVSAQAVAVAAPAAGAAAAGEEKTVFAVHLASSGAQKIAPLLPSSRMESRKKTLRTSRSRSKRLAER